MAKSLSVVFNAIDNISSKMGAIASSGRTVEAAFRGVENSANGSFGNIESGSDAISRSFERSSSAAESLASSMGTYGGEADSSFRKTAQSAEKAAEEMGNYGEQAEVAGDSSEQFGEKSVNAMEDLNSILVSGGIIAATHALTEALGECADNAEVVETSVAQLQTIAGGDSIGALRDDIVELSNDTGQAAEGLAETAYNAISAGTAAEESVNMATNASKLAVAGFTDTASALSVVETALNSYGDAAGDAEHISDTLITVQNLGVTTVQQLAAQMGKAISTASAYNVSLENLESGYISVTKAGIDTAEGTTYLSSMLNELGNSGSEISKLLKDETGNTFGELMNEGRSLADVLGIVYDACDNNAEAMMNMWGSAEAGKAANAIIGQGLDTFNNNLETLKTSAGTTEEAYAIMADTTEYAHNKMDNAAKNTSMQIGEVLNPTLTKLYAGLEEICVGIGNFVKENPEVVKVIAALTAGVAAFAGGIAAYTAATTIATAVQTAFNGAMLANPVFWLIGGIAALTAGVVFLASNYEDATDSTNDLTYASAEQEKRLESLRNEYDEVCESEGAGSKRATELASKIYDLEQQFGESGETVGQFRERIDELGESISETEEKYRDNIKSTDELYGSATVLIGELQTLQNQANLTDAEFSVMKSIVNELNGSYADLGLTIDEQTGKLNFSTDDLFDYASAQKKQQEIEAASQALVQALGDYDQAKSDHDAAVGEVSTSQDKYDEMEAQWKVDHPVKAYLGQGAEMNWDNDLGKAYDHLEQLSAAEKAASDHMSELETNIQGYCKTLGYSEDETARFIDGLRDGSAGAEDSAKKFGESGEELVTYGDAVKGAVNSVSAELSELSKSYDETYEDALGSIEGQYSLWDKVDKKVLEAKTSVDNIGKALDSQTQYWENYSKNLGNLQGRDVKGLDNVLKNMDDGSEENAAALAGMAKASDKELEKIVKKYNKLQNAQGKTANKVADLENDFSSSLGNMEKELNASVKKMNMEDDAAASAQKTIQAYINAIRSGVNGAQSAAEAVAAATSKALSKANKVPTTPTMPKSPKLPKLPSTPTLNTPEAKNPFALPIKSVGKNAKGTTDSEDVYVAGEEGPELILSKGGGDTVFPTSETDRIISAVSDRENRQITDPSAMRSQSVSSSDEGDVSSSEKTHVIHIEGGGSIRIGDGTSKEDVWNNAKASVKSAFMSILQEEIFEEGAGAYEF